MASQLVPVQQEICDPAEFGTSIDQFFLMVCAQWVLGTQIGYAFVEAGSISAKNVGHVLLKYLLGIIASLIAYSSSGYAFSFGVGSAFFGASEFLMLGLNACNFAFYLFHLALAATTTTIISRAAAGRTSLLAHVLLSMFITAIVYPMTAHWAWSTNGWLKVGNGEIGFQDYAGSGVVHVVGGTCALVGILLIGPRRDRIRNGVLVDLQPHSIPLLVLGGLVLTVGFLGFNAGSALRIDDETGEQGVIVATALVSTIVSAAGGGLCSVVLHFFGDGTLNIVACINGLLAGSVAVCAGADVVQPWAALVIGILAGAVFHFGRRLVVRLGLDDACDAVAVHLGAGMWGVIARSLFAERVGVFHAWVR
eukprot:m.220080 g.220080  ORF g.220080 m.220080 type:complete len:365 (-) comp15116_c1_seq39:4178-5272(-)